MKGQEDNSDSIKQEALNYAISLAKEVGEYQLKSQSKDLYIGKIIKSVDADFSTTVDRQSEKHIITGIKSRFPDHSILAEEQECQDLHPNSRFRWVIDPLDGTTNYFQKQDRFSISLALQEKIESSFFETQVGLIYSASQNTIFSCIRKGGAFCGKIPIRVSSKTRLGECIAHTNFPYNRSDHKTNNIKQVSKIIHHISNLRMTGCASLDMASVACGQADFYWEMYINLWDIAAGCLLVEEAGGACKILALPEHKPAMMVMAACNENILQEVEHILTEGNT